MVPFDTNKLNCTTRNEPVTPNKEKTYLVVKNNNPGIQNHQTIRKISKGKMFCTNLLKNKLPKGSINILKLTNAPNWISQSEP